MKDAARGSGTLRGVTAEADAQPAPLDPIAEAVRQWDQHDLGALDHMEATTALMRIQQIIVARIDAELRPYNLTFPQYEALVLLHFSRDGALPPSASSASGSATARRRLRLRS